MKLLKMLLIFSVLVVVLFTFTYGMAAFILWEPNPGKWSENPRSTVAFCAFLIFSISLFGSAYGTFKNDI